MTFDLAGGSVPTVSDHTHYVPGTSRTTYKVELRRRPRIDIAHIDGQIVLSDRERGVEAAGPTYLDALLELERRATT